MSESTEKSRLGQTGLAVVIVILLCFGCRDDSGTSGERVVLYCSVDQQIAEPIIAAFEQQTGIDVLPRFDTEASKTVGLIQRIRAEHTSPTADVFWSSEIFHTIRLAQESLLAPYRSETTKTWPRLFADPAGRWYGFALRARVIAYNTNRVSEEEAPDCLEDVLDSKWKGRIVMAAPEFGTTTGDVASWFANYGAERARDILQGLADNDIRLVSGNSTAVRMVATGQADICFTDTDDVYAGRRNGWPVAMNFLDQGGDGVLAIPNTVGIIVGAPHQKEAERLVEFLLSEQLEHMLAESDSHNSPIHPAVASRFEQYAIERPLDVDYEQVAQQLPTAIKIAREVLR